MALAFKKYSDFFSASSHQKIVQSKILYEMSLVSLGRYELLSRPNELLRVTQIVSNVTSLLAESNVTISKIVKFFFDDNVHVVNHFIHSVLVA